MRSPILISLVILLANCDWAYAQHDTVQVPTVYRVILKDRSEIIGTIQSSDSSKIGFMSVSMVTMEIPRTQIKSLEKLSGTIVQGEFMQSDPNYTRLFFAPTGRPLKNAQGYFSTYELFLPFVAVGIGDAVTLAGGMSIVPGAESQIYYLAPKITPVHLNNIDISAGLLYINGTAASSSGVGIVYGVGTYGTNDRALTVGLGWGFSSGEMANKPILLIGGEYRIARSVKFITENWIPPGTDLVIWSFGLRFFGERLAADLGLIRPSKFTSDGFPFIPWVGFAYNFGVQ
ncbi:MAG: hypothetical protein NTU47_06555 [Ignavibacteriales bacterium]|nr:hypothetical protein [Ignavibacteriales bacterium]